MAGVKEKTGRKEGKVTNLFFGSKMPKFNFGFGSSKTQKKETCNKESSPILKKNSVLLTPKQDIVEMLKKASPNLSRRSSKFSSNSPEIAKLRKNFLNAQEKHRIESFSITTAKIPILRAKITDSSNLPPKSKFETDSSKLSYAHVAEPNSDNTYCAKNFNLENQNKNATEFLPYTKNVFDIRTKTTLAENFFRPITQTLETSESPKTFSSSLNKPNASMNTKDFLAAFLAEKGTSRPVVQRGLVRERAKAFEQKIEEIKEGCLQPTPKVNPREFHLGEGKLVVPR